MPKIEKKPKPFVRATGSHYDGEKWKTVVDKTKFERKLDDWRFNDYFNCRPNEIW